MTAFFVFFFPILIFLGSWQVSRGMEKTKIVSQHNLNKSLPAIDEVQIQNLQDQELMYRTVNLEGTFGEQSYILDNRLYRQEAGYEVFTLFETSLNETYLVNRGWLSKEKIDMNKIFQEKKKVNSTRNAFSIQEIWIELRRGNCSNRMAKVCSTIRL